MPVWVGEWGAYYNHSESVIPTAISSVNLMEQHLFGNAYWAYTNDLENMEYFKKVLLRAYPAYTNGELKSYRNHFETASFTMEWEESKTETAPTVIFIPHLSKLKQEEIKGFSIEKIKGSDAGYLVISVTGNGGARTLELTFG